MAYYSTFVFQLPGCPEIHMSTRYDVIQDFDCIRNWFGGGVIPMTPCYKPGRRMTSSRDERKCPRVSLTKAQRRKVHTFLNVIYRKGIHRIPRKLSKFVKNDGVFPQELLG